MDPGTGWAICTYIKGKPVSIQDGYNYESYTVSWIVAVGYKSFEKPVELKNYLRLKLFRMKSN